MWSERNEVREDERVFGREGRLAITQKWTYPEQERGRQQTSEWRVALQSSWRFTIAGLVRFSIKRDVELEWVIECILVCGFILFKAIVC